MIKEPSFVLLVEDNDRLRHTIKLNLMKRRYMVLEASTFREAIDRMSIKPKVVILDIHLPDASGWDVADWLESQTSDVSVPVPVIVISAFEPKRKELIRHQPKAFLPKPFEMKQLIDLVETYAPGSGLA